jgi:hypothetical protein
LPLFAILRTLLLPEKSCPVQDRALSAAISAATLRVIPGGFSNISFVSDIAFIAIDAHSRGASIWEELGHGNRNTDEFAPFKGGH